MDFVVHRVNEIARLKKISPSLGMEVDIRANGSTLVMNHDPFKGGEAFEDWIAEYRHGLLVLNIKEAGIESEVIRLVQARGVKDFFLLDVEFPYLYRASRQGERRIAMRYSEDECIETVINYQNKVDWVWVDTNTLLPLNPYIIEKLQPFRTCLVCPERWGRPDDIQSYALKMKSMEFVPSAIMTSLNHVMTWQKALGVFH
jgi:hypothetical protein